MTLPSRRVLLSLGGVLLLAALLLGIPWLSPARGVERTWRNVVRAIEKNDRAALEAYLADNYKDGFGLNREEAADLVATVRGQFIVCSIRREQSELVLDAGTKRAAVTRAVIRIEGQGSPVATAVIQASQVAHTPTEFVWRRASWKPWDWRLISVVNPEASRSIARFQREAAQFSLAP